MTRSGPLRPYRWQLEANRIAGPGGIRELGLDYATEQALRGERLLLVDDVRARAKGGTLGQVTGLGPIKTARVAEALERHRPASRGRRTPKPAPDPDATATRGGGR